MKKNCIMVSQRSKLTEHDYDDEKQTQLSLKENIVNESFLILFANAHTVNIRINF